jgi:peptide/nickel transport system substrate-binding protein
MSQNQKAHDLSDDRRFAAGNSIGVAFGAGLTRRRFLKVSTAIAATAGIASLLAACGDEDVDDEEVDAAVETDDTEVEESDDDDAADEEDAEESDDSADTPAADGEGGRLIRGSSNDAENLDPHRRRTAYAGDVIQEMAETVIELNPNLEYDPILLDSFEVSDDGLIYTMNVRDDYYFQDGTQLDAEAIKISHERSVDEESTWPDQFYGATWHIIDDMTLEMQMPEPNAGVLMIMAFNGTSILSPTSIEEAGTGDLSEGAVGSGPFKFVEWDVNQQVVMERWDEFVDHYSHSDNDGPPKADELIFRVIPDEQTQIAAFETGEINILNIPSQQVSNFEDDDNYELYRNEQGTTIAFLSAVVPEGETEFVAPFDDFNVRRAVAQAVNVDEIIQGILAGLAVRNRSTMPTGNPGYTDQFQEDMGYDYDPDQAIELLEDSGWELGDDGVREKDGERLSILLRSVSETTLGRIAQLIQNQLNAVGFEIEYEGQERALFYEGIRSGEAELLLMDYNWGEADIVWWLGNDTTLPAGVYGDMNSEFQEVATEGWIPTDPAERAELYYRASQIMTEDVACIPLYTPVTVTGVRSEVRNFKLGGQGRAVYTDAHVEEN